MTTYERIEEIRNSAELTIDNAHDEYYKKEAELVELIGDYVTGAEVSCQTHGFGHIIDYHGSTLDGIIVDVEFAECTKKFSLQHIITVAKFIRLEDIFEIGVVWDEAYAVHSELTTKLAELAYQSKLKERAAVKKAAEEKKAEEAFQKAKVKAIKEFEELTQAERPLSTTDEFYYSLGYIAKHVGTISAALPDYLADSFKNYFGPETPCRVVDSKKKGPAGYTSQWSRSFSISLKKPETIPAFLQDKLNPTGKSITDTDFVWDLVDNYGFKFGKEQDVEKIRACVPPSYISFFEAGIA